MAVTTKPVVHIVVAFVAEQKHRNKLKNGEEKKSDMISRVRALFFRNHDFFLGIFCLFII